MRKNILVLAALALFAAPFVAASPVRAGDLEDAAAAQAAGDYEKALPLFEKAAAADPDSAEAAKGLSQVLAGLGRYAQAARAASTGLDKHPKDVGLMIACARAHMLQADAAAARGADGGMIQGHAADCDKWAQQALALEPKNSEARVLKVKVLQHQGGLEEAFAELGRIVEDDPKSFDAHWELGQHWFRQGGQDNKNATNWENALRHFEAALANDPTSGAAALHVAYSKHWLARPGDDGKYAEDVRLGLADAYERAASLNAGNFKAINNTYIWSSADPSDCLHRFERLTARNPDDAILAVFLAYALKNAEQVGPSVKQMKKALDLAPESYWVAAQYGKLLIDVGEMDKGIAAWDVAFGLAKAQNRFNKPDYLWVVYDVATQRADLDTDQRVKIWEIAWKHFPDQEAGPFNAGFYFRDTKPDYERSAKWYDRAVEAAPEDPQVLNDAGLIHHYHLKNAAKAEPLYVRAIAAAVDQGTNDPDKSIGYRDAVNNLVRLLVSERRKKDLNRIADEFLKDDPRYEQIKSMAK